MISTHNLAQNQEHLSLPLMSTMQKRCATEVAAPCRTAAKRRRTEVHPAETVRGMLDQDQKSPSASATPADISDAQLAAFSMELVSAIRDCDLPLLRALRRKGVAFDGCNRNAESLLHLACRRSSPDVVRFLLNEAGVDATAVDDLGRSALHDVCWKAMPNTELMEVLLDFLSPHWLLVADRRGHTPLDYARREHWGVWNEFLQSHLSGNKACTSSCPETQ